MAAVDPLLRTFAIIQAEAESCARNGWPYPPHLRKRIEAVHLMAEDWERGRMALIDALQDEIDRLDAAEYVPYRAAERMEG